MVLISVRGNMILTWSCIRCYCWCMWLINNNTDHNFMLHDNTLFQHINLKSMRNCQPLNVQNTKTYHKILTTYIRFLSRVFVLDAISGYGSLLRLTDLIPINCCKINRIKHLKKKNTQNMHCVDMWLKNLNTVPSSSL